MDIVDKMHEKIVLSMSKVSCEHIVSEEKRIKQELNSELNYDEPDRYAKSNNKKSGKVEGITVREISNGKDKYIVKDLLYSYHYNGRTDLWQYGIRVEDKNARVRDFSVTKDGKTDTLVLKKVKGHYQEYGDSSGSGEYSYSKARFSNGDIPIPSNLDLSDINAIRYHFKNIKWVAHFLDKYVIVTSAERNAYEKYAKQQDKILAMQKSKER